MRRLATGMDMVCDRFAFSASGNTASRRARRRGLSVEPQVSRLPAAESAGRHRIGRAEAMLRAGVERQLAAAEARIAELEAAVRETSSVASHDPLTGALNRRGMKEAFVRETARARRTGQPLALALIDLDDFKRINDRHGHAVGDAALVHLTRVVAETLRPTDLCCRLGGEEFVVVMPGADRVAADRALARLQAAIAVQPVADTPVTLAFSAGVVLAEAGESLEQMLARADRAVYSAKAAGKGCVVNG